MLIGEFESRVTDKNRVAVPAKIRTELKNNLILARGYEGCLILLDEKRFQDLIKLISVKPLLNTSVRDTRRFILGGAHEIELDAQGRFVLPLSLKQYAHIDTDVIFIGIMDWAEVWSREKWTKKLTDLSSSAADIAQRLMEGDDKT
jgi:MraZ protein